MSDQIVHENRYYYIYKVILGIVDDETRIWLLDNLGDENMTIVHVEYGVFKDGKKYTTCPIAIFNDCDTKLIIRPMHNELGFYVSIPRTRLENNKVFKTCSPEIMEKIQKLIHCRVFYQTYK